MNQCKNNQAPSEGCFAAEPSQSVSDSNGDNRKTMLRQRSCVNASDSESGVTEFITCFILAVLLNI